MKITRNIISDDNHLRTRGFYVYGLQDPETLNIDYIGSTVSLMDRYWNHHVKYYGHPKGNWEFVMVVLGVVSDKESMLELEKELIYLFKPKLNRVVFLPYIEKRSRKTRYQSIRRSTLVGKEELKRSNDKRKQYKHDWYLRKKEEKRRLYLETRP